MIATGRIAAIVGTAVCLLGVFAAPAGAAAPAWAPLAVSGPTNLPPLQSEVQRLAVDAEGGSFTLGFGPDTTAPLPFDVPASGGAGPTASVQNALEALPSIGSGNVEVRGGVGDGGAKHPYFVTFTGALANTDVATISTDSSGLAGGTNQNALVTTAVDGGPGTATIEFIAQNVGGFTSSGAITIGFTLPPGIALAELPSPAESPGWTCAAEGPGARCTTVETVGPGITPEFLKAKVVAGTGAASGPVSMTVSGGGAAAPATYVMPLTVSPSPAPPGFQAFSAGTYDSNGRLDARAGAHPYSASAAIFANTKRSPQGSVIPSGDLKDVFVKLPPGFVANPIAAPQCPESVVKCPLNTAVGTVQVPIGNFGGFGGEAEVVSDVQAPFGFPAKFKFMPGGLTVNVVGALRSDEDYGVEAGSENSPEILPIYGTFFTFWGAPKDPSHDEQHCRGNLRFHVECEPSSGEQIALITNPTNCAEEAISPPVTSLSLTTWPEPSHLFTSDVTLPPVTGCDKLRFEASFTFQPSETKADSPAAFSTDLKVPSEGLTNPRKLAVPEQKKVVVRLPDGVTLNPGAADGLGACSEAQMGLRGIGFPAPNPIRFTKASVTCPDSSKIGTIDVKTPLLANTLHGALYLAEQDDPRTQTPGAENPFDSLFAVYLVVDDPQTGIIVKLPGKTEVDPHTGQITATFENLPQLPFESLKLNFKGGSRSPLATPTTCGTFKTTTVNTPWSAPESGPPVETEDSFDIASAPGGGACARSSSGRPFQLGMRAGSVKSGAGAFSPFDFEITRPDGAQEIDTADITAPRGFTAVLKGVPPCPQAAIDVAAAKSGREEIAHPSCPAASLIGTTEVGAGSGPNPFYAPGNLYLAGPYKGAPLSLVAVTPAVAGPFDLGDVVVRSAAYIDPATARITTRTDPIPQFVDGIAVRLRDLRVSLDRKDWALNPTNCEPSEVQATLHGNGGAIDHLSSRFQVEGCRRLPFKPKLGASLHGGARRGAHPDLKATLNFPPGLGNANVKYAQVTLPHSEFLDQSHIRTVCTRPMFASHSCPPGSIYGHARAISPLLDYAVEGPVYLRSSDNKLPDLVAVLRGPPSQPIEVEVDGRIDSVHGGIRTTFEDLPDVPVSKFVLSMRGGGQGILVNSRNLCAAKAAHLTVRLVGQNGKRADQFPVLRSRCGRHRKHRKHRPGHGKTKSG